MKPGAVIAVSLALCVLLTAGAVAKEGHRLAEQWSGSAPATGGYRTIFVIGIADLTEERKHFENKFVSRLRTAGLDGVTSHSIVPHLDQVGDGLAVLEALEEKGVDAAITVRLVPLDDRTEENWSEAWRRGATSENRIRKLIDETLPVSGREGKRYGVEVALWDALGWRLTWAARSDPYGREELADESGNFVRLTLDALTDAGLIE